VIDGGKEIRQTLHDVRRAAGVVERCQLLKLRNHDGPAAKGLPRLHLGGDATRLTPIEQSRL
jgi:hypothetical protein